MINSILTGIFNVVINLVSLILSPIDLLIENALPGLDSGINAIGTLFAYISGGVGWAISLVGLSGSAIGLIVTYYAFKLTTPMLFYLIKLAIQWYDKLKP